MYEDFVLLLTVTIAEQVVFLIRVCALSLPAAFGLSHSPYASAKISTDLYYLGSGRTSRSLYGHLNIGEGFGSNLGYTALFKGLATVRTEGFLTFHTVKSKAPAFRQQQTVKLHLKFWTKGNRLTFQNRSESLSSSFLDVFYENRCLFYKQSLRIPKLC